MNKVFIVDGSRTAIGSFLGSLKGIPAATLGATVIKALVEKNKVTPSDISEIVMGHVLTAGQGQNPARQAIIEAGLPVEVPAYIVNQVCGSGLRAVALGSYAIQNGDAKLVISGGQESMSSSHHSGYLREGAKMSDVLFSDTMLKEGLTDAFAGCHMGITAENVAEKYKITREEQDQFAYTSQMKAAAAHKAGAFTNEITPVELISKKESATFYQDEFIRPDTTIEKLAKLRAAFKPNGTVTAGNASGINDGAAAVLLANEEMIKKYSWKPFAEIVSHAMVGVDPNIMGIGPIGAINNALKKAGWSIKDLDLIELNEAFASQSIAVIKELKLDINKVNVNGGAIALGHPIGASGARILVSLIHEMRRRNAQKALASLCIGGGMGIAMCIRSV